MREDFSIEGETLRLLRSGPSNTHHAIASRGPEDSGYFQDIFGRHTVYQVFQGPSSTFACVHMYSKEEDIRCYHNLTTDGRYYSKNPNGSHEYIQPILREAFYRPPNGKQWIDVSRSVAWHRLNKIPDPCVARSIPVVKLLPRHMARMKAQESSVLAKFREKEEKRNRLCSDGGETESEAQETEGSEEEPEEEPAGTEPPQEQIYVLQTRQQKANQNRNTLGRIQERKEDNPLISLQVLYSKKPKKAPSRPEEASYEATFEAPYEAPDEKEVEDENEVARQEQTRKRKKKEKKRMPNADQDDKEKRGKDTTGEPDEASMDLTLDNQSTNEPSDQEEAAVTLSRKRKAEEMVTQMPHKKKSNKRTTNETHADQQDEAMEMNQTPKEVAGQTVAKFTKEQTPVIIYVTSGDEAVNESAAPTQPAEVHTRKQIATGMDHNKDVSANGSTVQKTGGRRESQLTDAQRKAKRTAANQKKRARMKKAKKLAFARRNMDEQNMRP